VVKSAALLNGSDSPVHFITSLSSTTNHADKLTAQDSVKQSGNGVLFLLLDERLCLLLRTRVEHDVTNVSYVTYDISDAHERAISCLLH